MTTVAGVTPFIRLGSDLPMLALLAETELARSGEVEDRLQLLRAIAANKYDTIADGLLSALAARLGDCFEFSHQCRATGQPFEPGDIVERGGISGKRVGLLVGDHLQPVLQRPQPVIALAQHPSVLGIDQPGCSQRIKAGAGAA